MHAYVNIDKARMAGVVVMNLAYSLKDCPPSLLNRRKFPRRWPVKKRMRKRPVKAIKSFFPRLLDNACESQFIQVMV